MAPIHSATRAVVEGMSGSPEAEKRKKSYTDLITVVLAFIVTLILLAFLGKLLWNGVVTELFAFAKPAKSVWQILGLYLFVSLVLP